MTARVKIQPNTVLIMKDMEIIAVIESFILDIDQVRIIYGSDVSAIRALTLRRDNQELYDKLIEE